MLSVFVLLVLKFIVVSFVVFLLGFRILFFASGFYAQVNVKFQCGFVFSVCFLLLLEGICHDNIICFLFVVIWSYFYVLFFGYGFVFRFLGFCV